MADDTHADDSFARAFERHRRETAARHADERAALERLGVRTRPATEVSSSPWGSLDLDFDLEIPQIVLGVHVDGGRLPSGVARFDGGRRWLALDHQSAGIACDHPRFVATVLRPRTEVRTPRPSSVSHHAAEVGQEQIEDLLLLHLHTARLDRRRQPGVPGRLGDRTGETAEPLDPTAEQRQRLGVRRGVEAPRAGAELSDHHVADGHAPGAEVPVVAQLRASGCQLTEQRTRCHRRVALHAHQRWGHVQLGSGHGQHVSTARSPM